jgi:hypothetical protein
LILLVNAHRGSRKATAFNFFIGRCGKIGLNSKGRGKSDIWNVVLFFFAFCAFVVKKLGFVEALIGLYAPALWTVTSLTGAIFRFGCFFLGFLAPRAGPLVRYAGL